MSRELAKDLIEKLKGKIYQNIKIGNFNYSITSFSKNEFDFNSIKSIYGDYLTNSMFISDTEMSNQSYLDKLDLIINMNEKDGLSLWNIVDEASNKSIGLFGFTYFLDNDKVVINFSSFRGGTITKMCEIMTIFAFEYLGLSEIYGETLSYNYISQNIVIQMGMEEDRVLSCSIDYKKDSYLTIFKITREKYEEIKKANNNDYKLKFIKKDFNNPKALHSKARTIREALQYFKSEKQIDRYNHCNELLNYLKKRYPLIYKS